MRSMVEGAPLPTRVHDSENYSLEVVEHLFGRNTHSQETQFLKMSVSRCIPRWAIAPVVPLTIDLDREAGR
jgi:hypothetical protein